MSDETTATDDAMASDEAPASSSSQNTQPEPKMFTQEEVDKLIAARLARQKSQYSDYGELKEKASQVSALMSEKQKLQSDLESVTNDFSLAAADAVKLKVAIEKGVPFELVDRLKGDTPEEIAQDADQLTAMVKNPFMRGFDGGQQGTSPNTPESADVILRRSMGF